METYTEKRAGGNVETLVYNGKKYILGGWSGEKYTECCEIENRNDANGDIIKDHIIIKPVHDFSDEDDIKIIDFRID